MQDVLKLESIFQTKSLAIATDVFISEKLNENMKYDLNELNDYNQRIHQKLNEVEKNLSHDVVADDAQIGSMVMSLLNSSVELHHLYQCFIQDINQLIEQMAANPEFKVHITAQYLSYVDSGLRSFALIDRVLRLYKARITIKQKRALDWMQSGRNIESYRRDYNAYRSIIRGHSAYKVSLQKSEDIKHKIEVFIPRLLELCHAGNAAVNRLLFAAIPADQLSLIAASTPDNPTDIIAAGVNYVEYGSSLNLALGLRHTCSIYVADKLNTSGTLEVFLDKGVVWNFAKNSIEIDLNAESGYQRNFSSCLLTSLLFISVNFRDSYFSDIEMYYRSCINV